MNRRPLIGVGAVAVAVTVILATLLLGAGPSRPAASSDPNGGVGPTGPAGSAAEVTPVPTPRPAPGHELFGFLPYWEMNEGVADYLAKVPLTTLALHSVTHVKAGALDTKQTGYERITGPIGRQLIREAHARGVAVQIVYSSFGTARNERFLTNTGLQDKVIAALVDLAKSAKVDGLNVDIERLDAALVPAYGDFVGRLRTALRASMADGQVSVATTAGRTGAAMAAAAASAGADRIFLMGYDYHFAGSDVGASAPSIVATATCCDLPWSLDLYEALGVPVERTILGLPLYGMRWRVAGPEIGATRLGDGAIWVPADNPRFLADPPAPPALDPIEIVEFYAVAPTVSPVPGDSRATAGWQAIYVDSPRTLEPKLVLANERGLAGAGFWALGYERGLAGYRELMQRFADGKLD